MDNAYITSAAARLADYAITKLYGSERDRLYFFNLIISKLQIDEPSQDFSYEPTYKLVSPDEVTSPILLYALEKDIIKKGGEEVFTAELLSILSLRPSEINDKFNEIYAAEGSVKAAEFLHGYGIANDYVKASAIAKNKKWETEDGLVVTINLSKPEKSNKDTAALLNVKTSGYPACQLCKENIGYTGHGVVRQSLRSVDVMLCGEKWFWQYSPYAYFNEHGIAVNYKHIPMNIDKNTVERLLDFTDIFPQYFIGSNAALPRIGGSILNHDHYQGGGEILPMHKAVSAKSFKSVKYPACEVQILNWFNSAIRIISANREQLSALIWDISSAWESYSNAELDILPYTNERHSMISPVVRKTENGYAADIILRNNRTSEQYPDGIFHAHREFHNIKSESIGLIEAMGLFILPARLDRQLSQAASYLCGAAYKRESLTADMAVHADMIESLISLNGNFNSISAAENIVKKRVNEVCREILRNTAVFKSDIKGRDAFENFVVSIL